MKKMAAFLGGLILAGLIAAGPAAALLFVGAGDLDNSSWETEIAWLKTQPGVPSTIKFWYKYPPESTDPEKDPPIIWSTPFDYSAGTYVILKTGNFKFDENPPYSPPYEENYDHFAFLISGTDEFDDYEALMGEMANLLNTEYPIFKKDGTALNWISDNKASHFTFAKSVPVPIPGAVWLLGSGLLGLAGIRVRSKKKSA